MDITVTNLTSSAVYVREFYTAIPANTSIALQHWSPSDLASASALQELVAAGTLAISVSPTAAELASGMLVAPGTVQAVDHAAVAAASAEGASYSLRFAVAAGEPAEVPLFALGAVPRKLRILDAILFCSAAVDPSTATLQETTTTHPIGMAYDTAATGRLDVTATATAVLDPANGRGLFLVRSDDAVAGELILTVRPES